MTKIKILIGLAVALCAIAASAATASAEFESRSSKSTGSLSTGALTDEIGGCEEGAGAWTVLNKEGKPALKGPKLNQSITFKKCRVEVGSKKFTADPLKCEWQITEAGKEAGTESLISKCILKEKGVVEGCEITLEGKELKTVALTNLTTEELEVNSELEKVEAEPNAACIAKKIEPPSLLRFRWFEWQVLLWYF